MLRPDSTLKLFLAGPSSSNVQLGMEVVGEMEYFEDKIVAFNVELS